MTGRLVAELELDRVAGRMATAAAGRRLAAEARRHLAAGMPPVAVFAFDHVGRCVALWGRYEREELDLLLRAASPLLHRGGVALDVGANVGNHALFFAEHLAEVLAFEPNPRTFALLRFNAALRDNVRCFDHGLSDAERTATLTVPADNAGMASLHGGSGRVVECRLRRADDLLGDELAQRRVALLKIDVEGHEAAVLRGARALLARDRPLVVFEQAADGIRADGGCAVTDLLRDAGYRRFWTIEQLPRPGGWRPLTLLRRLLGGERLRLVEVDRLDRRFHSMVVALPA